MNTKTTAKATEVRLILLGPVMSELELARLGGGEVAYIKTLTSDEAIENVPADRRPPEGHFPAFFASRSRRDANRADRHAAGGHRTCSGRRVVDRTVALEKRREEPPECEEPPNPLGGSTFFSRHRGERAKSASVRNASVAIMGVLALRLETLQIVGNDPIDRCRPFDAECLNRPPFFFAASDTTLSDCSNRT